LLRAGCCVLVAACWLLRAAAVQGQEGQGHRHGVWSGEWWSCCWLLLPLPRAPVVQGPTSSASTRTSRCAQGAAADTAASCHCAHGGLLQCCSLSHDVFAFALLPCRKLILGQEARNSLPK